VVPEHLRFGGGVSESIFNPAVAVIMIISGLLILFLPRKYAVAPFLLTSILIPTDQILLIGGLHFSTMRVLILFGMIRIVLLKTQGKEIFSRGLNKIDKALILLSVTSAVAGILVFQETQAVIFQLGSLYNAFGAYFILRCFITDHEDVITAIRVLAFIVLVVGGVMTIEQLTNGWNLFFLLEGARGAWAMERAGVIRAMGPFGHSLLAGTFGAVLVPVFFALWRKERKYRATAILGIIGASVMTVASHSSTCLSALFAGLLGLSLWPLRNRMRVVRWGVVIVLVSLHMVMKAPVWHLISRLDLTGGSSGWHRYYLIDTSISHFWEWWLIGTKSNADWGWDMFDTADQYVEHAVSGGLLAVIFFVAIIVYGFKYLGRARQAATDKKQALFFWALGSALFAYTMSFIGISLWDQSIVGWYAFLALIGAVAVPHALKTTAPTPAPSLGLKIDAGDGPANLRWDRPSPSRPRAYAPLRRGNEY